MFRNYTIDKLHAGHYSEILNVWETSVRASHDFLNEADILTYKSVIENTYLEQLQLFGVRIENRLLGFIGVGDKSIGLLFVLPDTHGMGIGLSLVNYVYQHLHITEVDVNEQNTRAYDFYRHLGFEVTERSETDAIGKPYPVLSMKLGA
ncbi:MAG: GNAT family N-acetyltransferase [Pedobacter sp.]|jgi:putative acetyltransferase|uniref:GNAT family N-acetyltransferase n=1 Tax=Pedobacter sp. TaxID=1411316 RepID=UPI003392D0C1